MLDGWRGGVPTEKLLELRWPSPVPYENARSRPWSLYEDPPPPPEEVDGARFDVGI